MTRHRIREAFLEAVRISVATDKIADNRRFFSIEDDEVLSAVNCYSL
jgi:hypothetical protein